MFCSKRSFRVWYTDGLFASRLLLGAARGDGLPYHIPTKFRPWSHIATSCLGRALTRSFSSVRLDRTSRQTQRGRRHFVWVAKNGLCVSAGGRAYVRTCAVARGFQAVRRFSGRNFVCDPGFIWSLRGSVTRQCRRSCFKFDLSRGTFVTRAISFGLRSHEVEEDKSGRMLVPPFFFRYFPMT